MKESYTTKVFEETSDDSLIREKHKQNWNNIEKNPIEQIKQNPIKHTWTSTWC